MKRIILTIITSLLISTIVTKENPNFVYQLLANGKHFEDKGDNNKAIDYYTLAESYDQKNIDAKLLLASVLTEKKEYQKAEKIAKKATELQPKSFKALMLYAEALEHQNQIEKAQRFYEQAFIINSHSRKAWHKVGMTALRQHDFAKSIAINKYMDLAYPGLKGTKINLSIAYLTLGNYPEAVVWQKKAGNNAPLLTKENLNGKKVAFYATGGFGDTMHFIRYAKLAKDKGAYIIIYSKGHGCLKKLISNCPFIDEIREHPADLSDADYKLGLVDGILSFELTVDTIPADIPYLFADEKLVKKWQTKFESDKNFKIGLCWNGSAAADLRSIPIESFAALSEIPGISFYSLHMNKDDSKTVDTGNPNFIVNRLGKDFDKKNGAFMDTAAVMKNLNLIITIDTSIAHLAGALGLDVWTILPFETEWRWMLERKDTPWYPQMKLFRQEKTFVWKPVIQEVKIALKEHMKNR
ncbi:hypothetical protein HN446_04045 [bacterium]|jgi:hypothetical protein|nr:hypothetical protein [bacterium]